MVVQTKFLGQIEMDEKDIIVFEKGIPGFEDMTRYTLLPVEGNPYLSFLQSVEREPVCFIVISPFAVEPNYDIELNEDTIGFLEIEKPEEVQLYAIMNLADELDKSTVNLKAPIVVNITSSKGHQIVLDDEKYQIKHKLVKED